MVKKNALKSKVSPHFGVSVPYFHGGYSEGHFEVLAMSGRGSTKSERYLPTTNEKPSETMFQRVLLDFVLKTFGLGAENEPRARIRGQFSRTIFTPPNPLVGGNLGSLRGESRFLLQAKPPLSKGGLEGLSIWSRTLPRNAQKKDSFLLSFVR